MDEETFLMAIDDNQESNPEGKYKSNTFCQECTDLKVKQCLII